MTIDWNFNTNGLPNTLYYNNIRGLTVTRSLYFNCSTDLIIGSSAFSSVGNNPFRASDIYFTAQSLSFSTAAFRSNSYVKNVYLNCSYIANGSAITTTFCSSTTKFYVPASLYTDYQLATG